MSPATSCAAVLLDVDGVLIDTRAPVLALWDEVSRRLGGPPLDQSAHRHILGCSVEHTAAHLFPGADVAGPSSVVAIVHELEPGLRVTPVPGASHFVLALRAAGVPVALVTGASAGRLSRVVRALGLDGCVGATVTWGEAEGKPDPGPYLLAARRLGVDPRDCIVVEDAPSGVRSAVGAGATCIGLTAPDAAGELTGAGARAVVSSFGQLRVEGRDGGLGASATPASVLLHVPLTEGRGAIVVAPPRPHPPSTPRGPA